MMSIFKSFYAKIFAIFLVSVLILAVRTMKRAAAELKKISRISRENTVFLRNHQLRVRKRQILFLILVFQISLFAS